MSVRCLFVFGNSGFGLTRLTGFLGLLVVSASLVAVVSGQRSPYYHPSPLSFGDSTQAKLEIRLSEAKGQPPMLPAPPRATPQWLSRSETQTILDRLPVLDPLRKTDPSFVLPVTTRRLPKGGEVVKTVLAPSVPVQPVPPAPEPVDTSPVEIVRYQPDGYMGEAVVVSVTFSQPMVAVTSVRTLTQAESPVKITPEVPGTWQWIDTQTLVFQPVRRFPMATGFQVTVDPNIRSALDQPLKEGKTWSFLTPAPRVLHFSPTGTVGVEPLMVVTFNQEIDPAQVVSLTRVGVADQDLPVRMATETEVQADDYVSSTVKMAGNNRCVVFRALKPLPKSSLIIIQIQPGVKSKEGPLVSEKSNYFSFSTFAPLKIQRTSCSTYSGCRPNSDWTIIFSNPLDLASFKPELITINPPISKPEIEVNQTRITISGFKRGNQTYEVTLNPQLRDQFGQTLGTPEKVKFQVEQSEPFCQLPSNFVVTLDPTGPPTIPVYTVNYLAFKYKVYRVEPNQWNAYNSHRDWSFQNRTEVPPPPGWKLVSSKVVKLDTRPEELIETPLDLRPWLTNGTGHLVLHVTPLLAGKYPHFQNQTLLWVQSTRLAADAYRDQSDLMVSVTSLVDGKPVNQASVTLMPEKLETRTGPDGLGVLKVGASTSIEFQVLVIRQGEDSLLLPEPQFWAEEATDWDQPSVIDRLQWYVFDDRRIYQPGEELHLKGWIRRIQGHKGGDVDLAREHVKKLKYVLRDPRGVDLHRGELPINAFGGFDTVLSLPKNINSGTCRIEFLCTSQTAGIVLGKYLHRFQVEEFRRPDFEVSVTTDLQPKILHNPTEVMTSAKIYGGGALSNAPVTWKVVTKPVYFRPPNWDEFVFGEGFGAWYPVEWEEFPDQSFWIARYSQSEEGQTFSGKTDTLGNHRLQIDFDRMTQFKPFLVNAEATISDVNRQAISNSTSFLVHPSSLYVGLKSNRRMKHLEDEAFKVEVVVTDIEGKPVPNQPVTFKLSRETKKGWVSLPDQTATSANLPTLVELNPTEGGRYQLIAEITDPQGRRNQAFFTLWVTGGFREVEADLEEEQVGLISDKAVYQPGETAELAIESPFVPAEALLTVQRLGVIHTERLTITEPVYRYRLPILESHVPNMTVQVDLTGATTRTNRKGIPDPNLPRRPAFATGSLELVISPVTRTLTVTATPHKPEVKPGEDNVVDVQVVDSKGVPVQESECAVVVVDEAILALTGYRLIDPIKWFYVKRPAGTETERSRHDVLLADLEKTSADKPKITRMGGYGGFGDGSGDFGDGDGVLARPTPRPGVPVPGFKERKNFNPLAVFSPVARTDAEGRATIKFTMPDTLTRYRVVVVAVAGENKFGKIENVLTARLPLAIKLSPPRFLNHGDQCEFPVVIQNQTSSPQDVKVVIRSNRIEFSESGGQHVTVPANDQLEIRFPGTATQVGDAHYQVAALAGDFTDAVSGKIPIYTPATTEATATYGEVDSGGVTQPVELPSNVYSEYGGLEISTSSTQLQELTDAALYLVNYPYDCSEQIASRLLSVAALHDVLTAFQSSDLPPTNILFEKVLLDLHRLRSLQHRDGGFSYWRTDDKSLPFISVHVAHALAVAKSKGFGPLDLELTHVHDYLKQIEAHIPGEYSVSTRQAIIAYSLYVRHLLGDTDIAKARQLTAVTSPEALPLDAIGWVLPVLASDPAAKEDVDRFLKHLNNHVTETPATANFINAVLDGPEILLYSNRRTDGILLNALMAAQPDNKLIPKLVRGLLGHRTRGRWLNTQENVFILLALDHYFRAYEKTTPDFVARAWLGQTFAGEHTFRGRTTEHHLIEVPMPVVLAGPLTQNVVLQKAGAGRMYYRVGLKYAPHDKMQRPLDAGFKVSRRYEAVDHPDDVKQVSETEWSIRAGARVKITVRMVAPATRYHVALVDPLPAGLEILNPVLATTGTLPDGRLYAERSWSSWLRWRWFEHENLKSDRAEVFKSYLYSGVYQYSYYARATTPGTFFALPPKAEEMYFPETFGRGQTDVVTVK
ncbi:MAG: hypothetical protein HY774_07480 [Acidobacteria bacterium]|nr:hypothetical protein [Acidobacteriota bacterium]